MGKRTFFGLVFPMMVGAFIGAVLADAAAKPTPPDWFPWVVRILGAAALISGGCWAWLLFKDWHAGEVAKRAAEAAERLHHSLALDLSFDPNDPYCVQEFQLPVSQIKWGSTRLPVPDTNRNIPDSIDPPPISDVVLARLKLTNLREQPLWGVLVSVKVMGAQGQSVTFNGHPFPEHKLHQMFDDADVLDVSIIGGDIDPNGAIYVDLAMHLPKRGEIVVYYALPHLRMWLLDHALYQFEVTAKGFDDVDCRREVPRCQRTFVVGVDRNRRFVVDEQQIGSEYIGDTTPGQAIIAGTPSLLIRDLKILPSVSTAEMLPATPSQPSTPRTEEAPRQ